MSITGALDVNGTCMVGEWRLRRKTGLCCGLGGIFGFLFLLAVHYYLVSLGSFWAYRALWTVAGVVLVTSTCGALYSAWGRWELFVDTFMGLFVGVVIGDVAQTQIFPFESGAVHQYFERTLRNPVRDTYPGLIICALGGLGAAVGACMPVRREDNLNNAADGQRADSSFKVALALWSLFGSVVGFFAALSLYWYCLRLGPLVAYRHLGLESHDFFRYSALVAATGGAFCAARWEWRHRFANTLLGIVLGEILGEVLSSPLFPFTSGTRNQLIQALMSEPLTYFYPAFPIFGMTLFGAILGAITTPAYPQQIHLDAHCRTTESRLRTKAWLLCICTGVLGLLVVLLLCLNMLSNNLRESERFLAGRFANLPFTLSAIFFVLLGSIELAWKRFDLFLHICSWVVIGAVMGVPPVFFLPSREGNAIEALTHPSFYYCYPAISIFVVATLGGFLGATCDTALLRWYQRWFVVPNGRVVSLAQPIQIKWFTRLIGSVALVIAGGFLFSCVMTYWFGV
jgi:hypothetical protein